jgi:flagellar hook-associated protein 3 FlgL
MSIDRVATAQQNAFFLSQINQAGVRLDQTNKQIASGVVADTYAGFGDQAQVLQATLSAQARNSAYSSATSLATTQADLQNTQLTSLSDLAAQLKKAVSDAVANNDPSGLMTQVGNVFDQAVSILNSKDANGDYIYAGGKTDTAPVSISSLSQLVAAPTTASVFTNGTSKKAVQVADGQTVTFGITASSAAGDLMQALKDIATFDAGSTGNLDGSTNLSQAQTSFLTGQIAATTTVASGLTTVTAQNGNVYNQLKTAANQQSATDTLYGGFVDKLQNTNLAQAATQLSLNQTALQAALQVTASLNQLSLLNYLPVSSAGS